MASYTTGTAIWTVNADGNGTAMLALGLAIAASAVLARQLTVEGVVEALS